MRLALDTSCLTLSLALLTPEGALVEHVLIGPPKKQSDVLPAVIQELLLRHGLTLRSLTGLCCGLGPGSFTGLRIGLSCLKGLSYALKVPLVGVSSLRALALEGPMETELFCAAVVKRNDLYLGRYRRRDDDVIEPLADETSLPLEAFAARLRETPAAMMIGPAVPEYRVALEALGVPSHHLLDAPHVPSAVSLARLAQWPVAYAPEALFALEPHYVRGSGAEENPKFPPMPGVESKARLLIPSKEP